MGRLASVFFGIAVLVSLIQNSHAISEEEYMQKTLKIKSNPDVHQFLVDNEFVISQYGVLFDKLANLFAHFQKTEEGSKTLKHIWGQTEKVLNKSRAFDFLNSLITAFKKVLTSEVGVNNLISVASFVQSELQIPHLFKMSLSLKKMLLHLLFSQNGLKSLNSMNAHNLRLSTSKDTAPLMQIFNEEFPILMTIPPADTSETANMNNTGRLMFLANKLSFSKN